jgi:hypothetical protein
VYGPAPGTGVGPAAWALVYMFACTAVTAAAREAVAAVFLPASVAAALMLLKFHHPPFLFPALIGTESGSATRSWLRPPRPAIAMAWKLVVHQRLGCGGGLGVIVTTSVQPFLYASCATSFGENVVASVLPASLTMTVPSPATVKDVSVSATPPAFFVGPKLESRDRR